MFRQRSVLSGLILVSLLFAPGCHVLVRRANPAGQDPASELDIAPPASELPSVDNELDSTPPLPGLDSDDNQPPAPGLEARRSASGYPLSARRPRLTRDELWTIRSELSGNTGINTNTAIAPGEGQMVYRTQLRFLQSSGSPGPVDRDVNVLVNPHVLAYGVRENLSIFGVVPLVKRDGTVRPASPSGSFMELEDAGVADIRLFAKYRLREDDRVGETTRLSIFGGIEVPTFDKNFSSKSWDPFVGTVWTYQSLEWGLDLDLFWNFNTGVGVFKYDEMRYDAAYTYVLLTGQTLDDSVWQLNSIFELNGSYFTDGSDLLYAAPGFQLALESMIVEASLQLPVVRDLKNAIEPDYTFVIGSRITW